MSKHKCPKCGSAELTNKMLYDEEGIDGFECDSCGHVGVDTDFQITPETETFISHYSAKHTPGEWTYCGESHKKPCSCGHIWSKPADHPVAKVISGDWGDDYPTIKVEGGICQTAKPAMEQITYGHVPQEIANANARLIAVAPELLATLESLALSLSIDRDDYPDLQLYNIAMHSIKKAKAIIRKARGE